MNALLKKIEAEITEIQTSIEINSKYSSLHPNLVIKKLNLEALYALLQAYKDKKLEFCTLRVGINDR